MGKKITLVRNGQPEAGLVSVDVGGAEELKNTARKAFGREDSGEEVRLYHLSGEPLDSLDDLRRGEALAVCFGPDDVFESPVGSLCRLVGELRKDVAEAKAGPSRGETTSLSPTEIVRQIAGQKVAHNKLEERLLSMDVHLRTKIEPLLKLMAREDDPKKKGKESEEPIEKAGYLNKQGRVVKNWKLRYFILQGAKLRYYVSKEVVGAEEPKGTVSLDSCVLRIPDEKEMQQQPHMEIITEGRKLLIQAKSDKELQTWIGALNAKIALLNYQKKANMQGSPVDPRLVHFASETTRVIQLDLDNRVLNLSASQCLATILRSHNSVEIVSLQNAGLADLHVQVFADAITHNPIIRKIRFDRNHITHEGIAHLVKAVKAQTRQSLEEISLSYNQIGDKGLALLADSINANSVLTLLDVSYNEISNPAALVEALIARSQVDDKRSSTHSSDTGNKGEDDTPDESSKKADTSAPEKNALPILPTLNLAGNTIDDQGAKEIAKLIEKNNVIRTIHLQKNSIHVDGAEAIAKALEAPTAAITSLDLSDNEIGVEGQKALSKMLLKNQSLQFIKFGPFQLDKAAISALQIQNTFF